VETKRLSIRPIEQGDVERIVQLWTDPEVTRFMGGPKDPEMIRGYSIELATDPETVFEEEGDRWWSVCIRETGDGSARLLS